MKSAIGEKLTRKDHGDVSNQMYSMVSTYVLPFPVCEERDRFGRSRRRRR